MTINYWSKVNPRRLKCGELWLTNVEGSALFITVKSTVFWNDPVGRRWVYNLGVKYVVRYKFYIPGSPFENRDSRNGRETSSYLSIDYDINVGITCVN